MSIEDIYRDAAREGPSGSGPERKRRDRPSWSVPRTAVTVVVLLLIVGTVFWWSAPEPRDPKWWEPEGQKKLASPSKTPPIDLDSPDRALDVLADWQRLSWSEKREATRQIDKVFALGGTDYVVYVETNRDMIREHLEKRKRDEMVRRAAAESRLDGLSTDR